eukprot:GHVO01022116.1.p1 GENE.GHVO01022116.1~~GHVO01022116.1.p1  ORF type:complete len:189 (+),score=21.65 GHVO01022116.1:85-651(+)
MFFFECVLSLYFYIYIYIYIYIYQETIRHNYAFLNAYPVTMAQKTIVTGRIGGGPPTGRWEDQKTKEEKLYDQINVSIDTISMLTAVPLLLLESLPSNTKLFMTKIYETYVKHNTLSIVSFIKAIRFILNATTNVEDQNIKTRDSTPSYSIQKIQKLLPHPLEVLPGDSDEVIFQKNLEKDKPITWVK